MGAKVIIFEASSKSFIKSITESLLTIIEASFIVMVSWIKDSTIEEVTKLAN